jgi:uracil-DNA glycosylase family 4
MSSPKVKTKVAIIPPPRKRVTEIRRIPGSGKQPAPILIVGERPGENEAKHDAPFVGDAGRELDRYLDMAGLSRDRTYVTNLVKDYLPGNPDPLAWEIERDERLLLAEIKATNPLVIATVGRHATRWFLGDVDMDTCHGIPHQWNKQTWQADNLECLVVPCIHPAAGLWNPDSQPLIQSDFQALAWTLQGKIGPRHDDFPVPDYREVRTRYEFDLTVGWDQLFGHPPVPWCRQAVDTEGWRHRPWSLQYSVRPGTGYTIRPGTDATAAYIEWLQLQFQLSPEFVVVMHNSLHDFEVLRYMGVNVPAGRFTDTMIKAYLLCLEPQGLKPLAYRHAGMVMSSYEELTADADQMWALDYFLRADAHDWGPAEEYLIMERQKDGQLLPKIKKPHSINKTVAKALKDYADDPIKTDLRQRFHSKSWVDSGKYQQVVDVLDEMPHATLDDVPLDRAIQYASRDSDATLRIDPVLDERIDAMGLRQVLNIDLAIVPAVERMQSVGMRTDLPHFQNLATRCDRIMEECQAKIKELTGSWINPNSGDQVAELLFDQLGLAPTKLTKSKTRPSTNDKVLEALRRTHPVVPCILDYREAAKVKGSFAIVLPRKTGKDGRVHPTLRITRVSSGRLACTNPNLMAQPVRSDLGKLIREGFVADTGHLLSSHDLDQAEMRLMAHESEDPFMCEIFRDGRRDIHAETAARMFAISVNNVDKQKHRYPAKRVGFGVITGITGQGLADQMAMAGALKANGEPWTDGDCDDLIREWFSVYPGAKRYMNDCRAEARRYGYVRDMWGRIRYLPGIHSMKYWVREEAERQSHSHKIQAGAQGYIKIAMGRIWPYLEQWRGEGHWVEMLLQIHDELIHEFVEDLWPDLDFVVQHELENAAVLRVPMKAGGHSAANWADVKD